MDSLMAIELRNRLARALGEDLPAALVFDFSTIDSLAGALLQHVRLEGPGPARARRSQPAEVASELREPIAIIGMACRFPGGADDPGQFWQLLCEGRDAIRRVPPERWDADLHYDPDRDAAGKTCTQHGGFIDGIDLFDAQYFGISPREAAETDPQHRLLLELSHAALENAGRPFTAKAGNRTGIFVGLTSNEYAQMSLGDRRPERIGSYYVTGTSPNAAAGRVSYALGFNGPSLTVDTACSSSLVAVHLACASLRSRECDEALAAGVNLILTPSGMIAASRAHMLSADGRCKTFDASADGYGRGEGCGVVVLARLSDALARGARIWAVIRGSAMNQDGRSSGFTVPNGLAQQAVIHEALDHAGVAAEQVGYVEAHGTGTALGDPIEVGALAAVYAQKRPSHAPLLVGSVKTNIGHLESAAGIAGLIKTALVLRFGEIPRMAHFRVPNREIAWERIAVRPIDRHTMWPAAGRRMAAVSSFGVSGTNAHVVLEEAPEAAPTETACERPLHLLTISAKTPESLRQRADDLAAYLAAKPDAALGDLCFTANARARHPYRAGWAVASLDEARDQLRALSLRDPAASDAAASMPPKIAFLFGGAAGLHAAIGCELYATQPVFRAMIDALGEVLGRVVRYSLPEMMFGGDAAWIDDPARTWPAAFALEVALAELWRSWGVVPDVVSGQGAGEYAAACVAGIFDFEQGLRLSLDAGRRMARSDDGENAAGFAPSGDYRLPRIGFISTTSGKVSDPEVSRPEYWRGQFARPDGLADAIQALRREGCGAFIEIGPQPQFCGFRREEVADRGALWLPSLEQGVPAWRSLLGSLAALYLAAADVDLQGLDRDYTRRVVSLPTYPFQRRRHWVQSSEADRPAPDQDPSVGRHPLLGQRIRSAIARSEIEYESLISLQRVPFLADHRLFDGGLLPSSAYLEMAFAAAGEVLGDGPVEVTKYQIHRPAILVSHTQRALHTILRPRPEGGAHEFEIVGADLTDADSVRWVTHATGTLRRHPTAESVPDALSRIQSRLTRELPVAVFGDRLRHRSLHLGKQFAALKRLWIGDGEALGEIRLDEASPEGPFRLNPVLLDAAFQVVGASFRHDAVAQTFAQIGIERMTLLAAPGRGVLSHARLRDPAPAAGQAAIADLWLFSPDGVVIARIEGLQSKPIAGNEAVAAAPPSEPIYEVRWQAGSQHERTPSPSPEAIRNAGLDWLVDCRADPELTQYRDAFAAIESFCPQVAATALRDLGCRFEDGRPFSFEDAMRWSAITPGYRRLFERMLGMLAEEGWLVCRDGEWKASGVPARKELGVELDRLRRQYNCAACEIELLGRTSQHVAQVLRGERNVNELLMPGGDLTLLTRLYRDSPACAMMNSLVERVVNATTARWPDDRPLRILEIGAGTGATTARLVPHLPARRTEYVFSDASDVFTNHAATTFQAYSFLHYAVLDIDRNPADQGFASRQFDIIVAANVLHATAKLARTLQHVRSLMAPGALLVLLEGTEPSRLLDLTFGLTEGWWRFDDDPGRSSHCLIGAGQWQALLEANGFEEFCQASPEDVALSALPSQAVITARAAATESKSCQDRPGHWLVFADQAGTGEELSRLLRQHGAETTVVGRSPEVHAGQVMIALDQPADYRRIVAQALAGKSPLQGVVHLWSLDARLAESSGNGALQQAVELGCRSALHLAQALVDAQPRDAAPLYLVTRGAADALAGGEPATAAQDGLMQAPVWGISKVLASEHGQLRCHLIDMDPVNSEVSKLFDEVWIRADAQEKRVAIRSGKRYVARLAESRAVAQPFRVRADRSYLITGGLGGMGLRVAAWLVEQGARHLVLLGRSGPSPAASEAMRGFEQKGALVLATPADVARLDQCAGVFADIGKDMPPLAGVIHAAGVFADRLIADHDWTLFEEVFAAKIEGAWNLHRLTKDLTLDFFVLFSSAATMLGGAGIANYVAANEFLDALASYRRRIGLPGLSVGWGPWADVGMAKGVGATRKAEWQASGVRPMAAFEALNGLSRVLGSEAARVGIMTVDWTRFRRHPTGAALGRFLELMASSQQSEAERRSTLRLGLERAPRGARRSLLLAHVRSEVEAVLGWDRTERINPRHGFFDLGMDSLQANELRNRLQRSLACALPPTLTFKFPTVAALTEHLADLITTDPDDPTIADAFTDKSSAANEPVSEVDVGLNIDRELARLEELLQ
jgi:microcystin synthetase protein McyD